MKILITGASRGLGLGLVKGLLNQSSHNIIATCRNPINATELASLCKQFGNDRLFVLPLEVTSQSSHDEVKNAIAKKGISSIDILLANAGIASADQPSTTTEEDMHKIFNTNTVGSMLTLQKYSDLLCASQGKLAVMMSSILGSIKLTKALGGGLMSYRVSKAALNMMAMTYMEDEKLRAAGCKALCMHPGWVATDMGASDVMAGQWEGKPIPVEESVKGMLQIIDSAVNLQTGKRLLDNSPLITAQHDDFRKRFSKDNCTYVGYDGTLLPW